MSGFPFSVRFLGMPGFFEGISINFRRDHFEGIHIEGLLPKDISSVSTVSENH